MLIGHEKQAEEFLGALAKGQLHHAWMLAGPRGVGKRRFADLASLRLLSGEPGGFDVAEDHSVASLVKAGSHLDHRVVERLVDDKGKRAGGIAVEQIRALLQMLHGTAVLGQWRTVIIDSIDDLNRNAANALLKALEEPPADTVFFLISHAPGRLLPTIRSRCRMLRFQALADHETEAVLRAASMDEAALPRLVALAEGAPGSVLGFADVDIAALDQDITRVWRGSDRLVFARSFGAASAQTKFEAFLMLAPRRLAAAARATLSSQIAELEARARIVTADAVALAYDRVQVALALADILAHAGHIEGSDKRT